MQSGRRQPISEVSMRQRLRLALCAAKGMAHLHNCALMHRDIKSANMLLDRDDASDPCARLLLCDLGFARAFKARRDSAEDYRGRRLTVCGTDDTMAPEVNLGMEVQCALIHTPATGFALLLAAVAAAAVAAAPLLLLPAAAATVAPAAAAAAACN